MTISKNKKITNAKFKQNGKNSKYFRVREIILIKKY